MLEDSIERSSKRTQVLVCRGACSNNKLCNVSISLIINIAFPPLMSRCMLLIF